MVGCLNVCGRCGGRDGEEIIVVRGAMLGQFGEGQNESAVGWRWRSCSKLSLCKLESAKVIEMSGPLSPVAETGGWRASLTFLSLPVHAPPKQVPRQQTAHHKQLCMGHEASQEYTMTHMVSA